MSTPILQTLRTALGRGSMKPAIESTSGPKAGRMAKPQAGGEYSKSNTPKGGKGVQKAFQDSQIRNQAEMMDDISGVSQDKDV